jgi:hypothetical protein
MTNEYLDPGDQLVAEVAAYLGGLGEEEQVLVYGLGHAYNPYGAGRALPTGTAAWIGAALRDFRAAPCRYCGRGLAQHRFDLEASGPRITCISDGSKRTLWQWHGTTASPPAWRVLLGVGLWVGIPLTTLGLAGWLMPTVAAITRRDRLWATGAAIWGLLTIWELLVIESESAWVGLLALVVWLGSAVYGGLQVKRWARGPVPDGMNDPADL